MGERGEERRVGVGLIVVAVAANASAQLSWGREGEKDTYGGVCSNNVLVVSEENQFLFLFV